MNAVLSVKTLLKCRVVSINVVENMVGILLLSRSEHHDLVPLTQLLQNILNVRSQSHRNFSPLEAELKGSFKAIRDMVLEFGCDKSFIHVKNEEPVF